MAKMTPTQVKEYLSFPQNVLAEGDKLIAAKQEFMDKLKPRKVPNGMKSMREHLEEQVADLEGQKAEYILTGSCPFLIKIHSDLTLVGA